MSEPASRHIQAVICGSYRKAREQLRADFSELQRFGVEILSPRTLDFSSEHDAFVYLAGEEHLSPSVIEAKHLAALERSDFVWLHDPESYVGTSGALEIGFAHALGIQVFARRPPADVTLSSLVRLVSSPAEAVRQAELPLNTPPARSLAAMQSYYAKVAQERAYDKEDARECMLLLTEELGELARAVRKTVGLARHGERSESNVSEELADVQLYIVHLANILGVSLAAALGAKERVNAERFATATRKLASATG